MKAAGLCSGILVPPLTWMVLSSHNALLHPTFVRVNQSRSDQGMTIELPSHEPLDVAPTNKHHVILFQSAAKFETGDGIEFALSPGSSPFEMAHHPWLAIPHRHRRDAQRFL